LRDDDEEVVEHLLSNKEVTLQTAFCRKSDCDLPFDFIRCPLKLFFGSESTLNVDVEHVSELE